jgi:hypothetical protein
MIDNTLTILSNSKIFIGLIVVFVNLGSKYIPIDMPTNIDKIFTKYFILRVIVLYSIFFMTTRDIKISLLLLLLFLIFIKYIVNEDSNFCLININSNNNSNSNKITDLEYENAKNIIKSYEEHKKNI